jgi:hypothetical protein
LRQRVESVRRSARAERFRARAPRIAFWAVVAILAVGGLKQIVAPASGAGGAEQEAGLVDHAAEELAQRFARAYLSYDVARPAQRERALAELVPSDFDAGGGYLPLRGSRQVISTSVAQHQLALAGGVIVVVAAILEGEVDPVYLGVPIERRANGTLLINAYPSLLGPPKVGRGSLPLRESLDDEAFEQLVERVLNNYLTNNRQDLAADLVDGAEVSPPSRRLRLISVDELVWAQGPELGAMLATVIARDDEGATWTLSYELGIEQSEPGGRASVTFIETVPSES